MTKLTHDVACGWKPIYITDSAKMYLQSKNDRLKDKDKSNLKEIELPNYFSIYSVLFEVISLQDWYDTWYDNEDKKIVFIHNFGSDLKIKNGHFNCKMEIKENEPGNFSFKIYPYKLINYLGEELQFSNKEEFYKIYRKLEDIWEEGHKKLEKL